MRSTLVLNASYEPLHMVSAQRALKLVLNGRAVSLDDAPYSFRSVRREIPVPYVVLLTRQAPHRNAYRNENFPVPFSRRGVLVRDGFICAYCGNNGADTFDHIVPRKLGGGSSWANCVAACKPCNFRKGHKTLQELGWKMRYTPTTPDKNPVWGIPWYVRMLDRVPQHDPARVSWATFISLYDSKVTV